MLQCVEKLISYTSSVTYDDFSKDPVLKDAVLRNVQVLGEAANRVPISVKERYPDVEWNKIIRSRHIVTHDYFVVDFEIVWRIATVHTSPLKSSLQKILADLEQ